MRNQRRSHSLQPINRASIVDPQFQEFSSLVSTNNLAQVLLLQTAERHPLSRSSSSSSPAPSLERSPPVSRPITPVNRRTTSRPNRPPPPPPQPPPYDGPIFDHIRIPSHLLNEARPPFYTEQRQRLQRLLYGLIPDPTNIRSRRSPLTFEPTRTARDNIDLLNDVKKLIIQASELHQDIEVKLTRIQLQLLRQDFERQDEIDPFSDLH
jgi:hypothetical protein